MCPLVAPFRSGLRPALRLLLLAAVARGAPALAQPDTVRLSMDGITVADGLPQGLVSSIVQDSTGYLWFGTKDGLARYDGYGFTVFRHLDEDTNSIASDHITSLLVDREGRLWVGLLPFGLDRYDPRTGRFSHVRVEGIVSEDQAKGAMGLMQDRHGRIWTRTNTGQVGVVEPRRPGRPVLVDPRTLRPPIIPLQNTLVITGPEGEPWFGNADTIRCVRSAPGDAIRTMDRPYRSIRNPAEPIGNWLLNDAVAGRVLCAESGWITSLAAGEHLLVDTLRSTPRGIASLDLLDQRRRLWYRSSDTLYYRATLPNGPEEFVLPEGDAAGHVQEVGRLQAVLQDAAGTIWFNSAGFGAFRWNVRSERFKVFQVGEVHGIFPADLAGQAITRRSQRANTMQHLRPGHLSPGATIALVPEGFGPRGVVDRRGRVWTVKSGSGSQQHACVLEGDRVTLVPSMAQDTVDDGLFPGLDNTVWMVSIDLKGTVRYITHLDAETGAIIRRYPPPITFGSMDYLAVASMTHLPDGTVWMGTVSGLLGLDPATGVWTVYRHNPGDPRSLPNDMVFATCADPAEPSHILWVGTSGGGLARLDLRTGTFTAYTTRQGLPNNVVYGILSDKRGNLWVSTNQGLCRFAPRTGAVVTYTTEDGLPSNEFNRYSCARTSDGRLWFEGMGGAFHFDPEDFYTSYAASPTVITGMKLVGKAVAVAGAFKAPGEVFELPTPIEFVRSITLPYSERMITFSFACMDHTAPLKNTFRYILEGFSTKWVEVGTQHEATFTNLDPGTYTFRVQGRNSAGVWDERGAVMQLIITPPWWGTWWFRIAALVMFFGALYAFYRYRLAQAVKVVRVRERIARDLHDEIGSTLSSVSLFSSVAQKKAADKAPEASELLGRITDSTTQVLEAMNDIVWAVNADNDDLASVIKRMHAFAVSVTEARGCKLHLHADEELKVRRLEMTQRKNLYLIFKEAVNNAMKYADCANLRIELLRDRSSVVLRVVDDGRGFDPNAINGAVGGGNGLGNMHKRAAEIPGDLIITSAPGQGTAVELRFVPGAK